MCTLLYLITTTCNANIPVCCKYFKLIHTFTYLNYCVLLISLGCYFHSNISCWTKVKKRRHIFMYTGAYIFILEKKQQIKHDNTWKETTSGHDIEVVACNKVLDHVHTIRLWLIIDLRILCKSKTYHTKKFCYSVHPQDRWKIDWNIHFG